jgi:hypothetical protein
MPGHIASGYAGRKWIRLPDWTVEFLTAQEVKATTNETGFWQVCPHRAYAVNEAETGWVRFSEITTRYLADENR